MSHHDFLPDLGNPEDRRAFIQRCATLSFGLTVLPHLAALARASEGVAAPNAGRAGFGKAKRVIFIELAGGMSHIDTFDPKAGSVQGPGSALSTKGGFQVTSFLPLTARIADRLTIIRNMTAKTGVHASASYVMRTGFEQRGATQHPNLGAWARHFLGPSHATLPSSVSINRPSAQGNGWWPSSHAPLPLLNPESGLPNAKVPFAEDVSRRRLELLGRLDAEFESSCDDRNVRSYNQFYDATLQLVRGSDVKAFDLTAEPAEVRERYGKSRFGQGCLLARRLVENGVRFVEVRSDGWDMHAALEDRLSNRVGELDVVLSTLIQDLETRGMLDSTLVAVTTEFGRKPEIEGGGRGHHPLVFSTVLAGGGVKRGYVHGASDAKGYAPDGDGTTPGSLHATLAHAVGLPVQAEILTPEGRPMQVGNRAAPVNAVFI